MSKSSGRGSRRRTTTVEAPRLKLFRPKSWYGSTLNSAADYVEHLLTELGRLGLDIHDIERHDRAPHTKTVLSDLMGWFSEHPSEAYAKLVDWRRLDLRRLQARLEQDPSAKPRIELSAHITKMNNLSVRWYPKGWRNAEFDWHRTDRTSFNLITHLKWAEPPDFRWFEGDEDPTFDSRPSNELLYLRGVGNLRPEPRDKCGPYATFNDDVIDSILICAVRAAYQGLIDQLRYSFEVGVIDAFDFVLQDEVNGDSELPRSFPVRRVIAWSLEDAAELEARRQQEARAEQDRRDREELADLSDRYGFTIESFVNALELALSKKPTGPAPSGENLNRNAAKALRSAGFNVNAANIRRIRQLVERYTPDALPPELRPPPSDFPADIPIQDNHNVVQIPSRDK